MKKQGFWNRSGNLNPKTNTFGFQSAETQSARERTGGTIMERRDAACATDRQKIMARTGRTTEKNESWPLRDRHSAQVQ